MKDICKSIADHNKGRIPDLLNLKYKGMREDIFRFYRGTCHLFYDSLNKSDFKFDRTQVWVCGDLHLENFGTYKGSNQQVYFDLNDFDESVLAPCSVDLIRVLTSIHVAGKILRFSEEDTIKMNENFLQYYVSILKQGKAFMVEKATAKGVVKSLFRKLELRKRKAYLSERMVRKNGRYALRIIPQKTIELEEIKKQQILNFFKQNPICKGQKMFRVTDAAYRIAGTGSLGIERYVLLTFEEKAPHKYHLFDMKEALPSALNSFLYTPQPTWKSNAERVCEIQNRAQGVSPGILFPVRFNKKDFVLKRLQPSSDKVNLASIKGKKKQMTDMLSTLALVTASAHLRSGGRQGSSIADELIAFANEKSWQKNILQLSLKCFKRVKTDYQEYCKNYDKGFFTAIKK